MSSRETANGRAHPASEPYPLKRDRPTWNAKAAKPAKPQIQLMFLRELCALCVRRRGERVPIRRRQATRLRLRLGT
jgi:hypothetical protein